MKENFCNLVKEIDMQVQEATESPTQDEHRRPIPRHIIIKMPKIKDKERILKAAREKQRVTYKGVPIRLPADFSKGTLQASSNWQRSMQSDEKQGPTPKITLSSKTLI